MIRGILSKVIGSSRFILVFIILSLVLGLYSYCCVIIEFDYTTKGGGLQ